MAMATLPASPSASQPGAAVASRISRTNGGGAGRGTTVAVPGSAGCGGAAPEEMNSTAGSTPIVWKIFRVNELKNDRLARRRAAIAA
jgi:hypothetical protein